MLDTLAEHLPDDPFDLEGAERRFEQVVPKNGAARAALSGALHDLVGKRLRQPLWRLWGLDPAKAPTSSFTIGIDTPEKMRQKVAEAADYPILKIKLGTDHDEALLRDDPRRDRQADPRRRQRRMDARAGPRDAPGAQGIRCGAAGAAPGAGGPRGRWRRCAGRRPASRSWWTRAASWRPTFPKVAGAVDGINIKLAKCGSLREALRMIATARAHGLLVMVGCMIETSIGITAAAHFTPLVDVADLDGAALTVDDPFTGARIERGRITLPTGPGLGVARR